MAYRAHPPSPLNLGNSLLWPPPTLAQSALPTPPPTPLKLVYNGFRRWAHQLIDLRESRDILTKEMTGNFIGPMPATDFVRHFMKSNTFEAAPKVDFTKVPYDGIERGMYTPFVRERMYCFSSFTTDHSVFPFLVRCCKQFWYLSWIYSGGYIK